VQTRVRNEAYDCWKYALAALRIAGIDLTRRAAQRIEAAAAAPKQQKPRKPSGGFVNSWKGRR
jgi:phage terminase large subunit GpA-like protein